MVKSSTICIVLSIAVTRKWRLHQLDVKNAFLNVFLNETVYMEQPSGFTNSKFLYHVCHLKKALYGLKQAPLAWFQKLSTFLLQQTFYCIQSNTSLCMFHKNLRIIYLLVYVDDIVLTGNDESSIGKFSGRLRAEFSIKDMGTLNYFLGLEVSYNETGLFLNQSKYAHDILTCANLLDSKLVVTTFSTDDVFVSTDTPYIDPIYYRSLVGALQYLTITCPNLSYVINQANKFLHAPTIDHF